MFVNGFCNLLTHGFSRLLNGKNMLGKHGRFSLARFGKGMCGQNDI